MMSTKADEQGKRGAANLTAKTVEVQLIKSGREHPIWSVNVKVNGRAVEVANFPSKREAFAAMGDLANKYR